jgi:mono/diheme cytochrome c family protein
MSKATTARILSIAALMLLAGAARPLAAAGQDDAVKKGAQVYAAQKCQTCHSIGGKGGKASALDGVGKKLSADEIKAWIVTPTEMTKKSGSTKKPPMPNRYSKLPAADIDAMVAYLSSLK